MRRFLSILFGDDSVFAEAAAGPGFADEHVAAAALMVEAMQYGSGIFGSALVGVFADGTPWPMGWVIALCGLGSLASTRLLVPPRSAANAAGESGAEDAGPGRGPPLAAR